MLRYKKEELENCYKSEIKKYYKIDSNNIFFYWKARVALYAILKAMGIGEGDEVIVPGLTCVVVPNAILYLNAKPVYVDVDLTSCNTNLDRIRRKVSRATKVIIVQNTFGLSSEVDKISKFAKENGIYTIEDCTHGFGGTFRGRPNGVYCDAAIYSTQWNKPFSTGVGGFCIISNIELVKDLKVINQELLHPTITERLELRLLLILNKLLLTDKTYWILLKLYRLFSRLGLVIGSSSNLEITSVKMPKDYFKSSSRVQFERGSKSIKGLDSVLDVRKKNALRYSQVLQFYKKYYVDYSFHEDHSFLKYPILIKDRKSFLLKAEKHHIKLGDWFVSPLHPVRCSLESWLLNTSEIPNAVYLADHLLNLPTDVKNVDRVIDFIVANIADFIDNG